MGLALFYKAVTSKPLPGEKRSIRLPDMQQSQSRPVLDSKSLATGYRQLSKNQTLAGRDAARHFNGEDRYMPPNRLRMVSRLRHKEKFLIWRHIFQDLGRYVLTGFNRFNPAAMLIADPYSSAVRRR